jgi:hypothetical protein
MTIDESYEVSGRGQLVRAVELWRRRLEAELRSAPSERAVRDQEEQIAEFVGEFAAMPDEFFTRDEAEVFRQRLEDFETRFAEHIRANTTDGEELKKRLSQIEQDVSALNDGLSSLTKRGWAGSLANRVFGWLRDPMNRKLLSSGAAVAKELLLEAGTGTYAGK